MSARTTRLALLAAYLFPSAPPIAAQARPPGATITGRITDAVSATPVSQAVVNIEGTALRATSDAQGRYRLDSVPPGPQVLRVIRIGYAPVRTEITVPGAGALTVNVTMAKSALYLPNLTVTADPASRAKGELGTASVIEREAIRNQTAVSLQGLLELLPGVTLQPPGLDGVQQFGLRGVPVSTGAVNGPGAAQPSANDLASFGTQIVLDGVPLSNNANLQSLGPRGELSFATSSGGGIDLRRLPASTIERVEVIRGVPSARFGDLTQGAVLVDTRAGVIDPELLVRLDARTIEASAVGGAGLGAAHTASGTFDVARTKVAPGQTDDVSWRYALQAAHRYQGRSLRLDTRLDAYQLVEDRPEASQYPGVESHSRDNGFRLSQRGRADLGTRTGLEWTVGFDLTRQRSMSSNMLLRAAMPFTDRLTEGTQVGKFVSGPYLAQVDVQGDPRAVYARLEVVNQPRWLGREGSFRAGAEFRREWNAGPGYLFDIEFPPQVTFNGVNGYDRPRDFDQIPPIVTSGWYADGRRTWRLGSEGHLGLQAGLRLDLLHEGSSWVSGLRDQVFEPRVNLEVGPTRSVRFRLGAGRLAKLPSLAQLAPGIQYYDLVNVNYYANNPAERLAVLTTRIEDRTNPDLGYSVADRLEAGFEAELAPGAQIGVAAFRDRVNRAVGISSQPTMLLRELYQIVDSTIGTGRPPDYQLPAYATDTVPVLIDRPSNTLTLTTTGVELIATVPEIPGTRTRLALLGSYVRNHEANAGVEFGPDFSNFQLAGYIPRSPYWEGSTRAGDLLVLTTRLIHQQPQAGLVITATVQGILRETREDIAGTDTLSFAGYITRAGVLVPVPVEDRTAPEYHDLRKPRSGLLVEPQRGSPGWLFSLQVAKTLPGGGRLSFYAFNLLDQIGTYGGGTVTPRLYPATRFGLEVSLPIMVWK